jgi:hypothetical protein
MAGHPGRQAAALLHAYPFAGLWDEWKDCATGETLKSCTMIIMKAKQDPEAESPGANDAAGRSGNKRSVACIRFG